MHDTSHDKGVMHDIEEHKAGFSLAFILIFSLSFIFLAAIGATPNWPGITDSTSKEVRVEEGSSPASAAIVATEMPVRIAIPAIGLETVVSNPSSTETDVLDSALLKGAVRYPTSAQLGMNGTVLLFGHSSYLPVVHNLAFKTFDGIQNLDKGDEIRVFSSDKEYRYKVTAVRKANATEDTVNLPSDKPYLTLVTCDSFGTKSDRFVVEAALAGTYLLAK